MKIEIVGTELVSPFRERSGGVLTSEDFARDLRDPDFDLDSELDRFVERAAEGLHGPVRIAARFGGVEMIWNVPNGGADLPPSPKLADKDETIDPYLAGETFVDVICALLAVRPDDYND